MALPTFEKKRLIGLLAILSFGFTALFAVLLPEVLGALIPATFIFGFLVLIPLVALLGEDFPLAEPAADAADAASAEDPLTTLRDRYASGEIGEEEFERKLDRLLETEGLTNRADDGPDRERERDVEFE
ncbi:SHOCT domain-containing protein [Halorubrum amylolyticum]|uniref:SHOCT domain-containing protein n=1 Tax=Halorubrum amylolyticum TaxID=2508724 RepID=UPI0010087E1A|nr:SHOCT domain-containing protein [Halorubrum amylolyticum]